jgi:hypothetical protein
MRLIKLPTCETDTSASRNNTIIDGLIVHTTDTGGLKRVTTIRNEDDKKYVGSLVKRALDLPGVTKEQCDMLMFEYVQIGSEISDALRLCIQAAGLPRRASWHYCVASKKTKFPLNRSDTYPGVIDTDVIEFVPPELQAHHIGELGKPTNRRSIGIENMYPCALSKGKYTENEAIAYYENIGWSKPSLKRGPDGAKYWYTPISDVSLLALEDLCVDLVTKFPSIYWIGSHFQFCAERIDPDPPIDLVLLRKNVTARTGRTFVDKPKGAPKVTPK